MALYFGLQRHKDTYISGVDTDASWGLIGRMYAGENRSLSMVVFGTELPPAPPYFQNPDHPSAIRLASIINQKLLTVTSQTVVGEWRMNPDEIEKLEMQDPRVAFLRQKLAKEIILIPEVQRLHAKRVQLLGPVN